MLAGGCIYDDGGGGLIFQATPDSGGGSGRAGVAEVRGLKAGFKVSVFAHRG